MGKQPQRRIGALLFPDFELLDIFSPLEMFTLVQERGAVEIVMVAQQPGPVSSVCGPACVATVGFGNCSDLDRNLEERRYEGSRRKSWYRD